MKLFDPTLELTRMESVDWEHSEPGTGSPPQPRETPVEKDAAGGWRRDTPPIAREEEGGE